MSRAVTMVFLIIGSVLITLILFNYIFGDGSRVEALNIDDGAEVYGVDIRKSKLQNGMWDTVEGFYQSNWSLMTGKDGKFFEDYTITAWESGRDLGKN